jgi:hypothetical protein
MPSAHELPEDIRRLPLHHAHDVSHARFGRDIGDLKEEIRKGLGKRRGSRNAWRFALGLVALVLLITLVISIARYGLDWRADHGRKQNEQTQNGGIGRALKEGPALAPPPVTAGLCSDKVTFACLRAGLVHGHIAADLRQTECTEERIYLPAELENDALRVGGWGDLYYALMQFETPRIASPVRFAAVLLFAKQDDGLPVAMHLDRIADSWGWRAGDRLWWKDRPNAVFVTSIPQPTIERWYAIDITGVLEDWRLGRSVNYGLQLRPTANAKNFNIFHSTRSLDLAKQPRLLVCT